MEARPLLKLLIEAGLGSRRRMADAIRRGRVQVNGEGVEGFSHLVDVEKDTVTVNGEVVELRLEPLVYLMLNKPAGVLSTTRDERGRRTVMDLLPGKYRGLRLYPVGRLDKDSTGLIILTNDGRLTYRLTHPRFEREKEYLVFIEGRLRPVDKERIRNGLQLDDGMTCPAVLKEIEASPPFNYRIAIHEGRKRQVRRMFEKLGYPVLALKRVRIESLSLGKLGKGQTRELSAREVGKLLSGGSELLQHLPTSS
ncbi:MAG: pseudouridine synthase [Chloroflexota bacterium]|nr:pseudouridine synthase [Chloroflexota bacterium]